MTTAEAKALRRKRRKAKAKAPRREYRTLTLLTDRELAAAVAALAERKSLPPVV